VYLDANPGDNFTAVYTVNGGPDEHIRKRCRSLAIKAEFSLGPAATKRSLTCGPMSSGMRLRNGAAIGTPNLLSTADVKAVLGRRRRPAGASVIGIGECLLARRRR
jgi:hypothetical protein